MKKKKNAPVSHKSKAKLSSTAFRLLSSLSIIILGAVIYSNSFHNAFQFDDFHNIVGNESIRNISDLKSIWNFMDRRFVGYLTFALNYHFHELNVVGYHVTNLIIHLGSSLLAWWLTLLILSSKYMKDTEISRKKDIIALGCGLIFVSHPLQTQAIVYIVQRLASLATFFYLATLCLYMQARQIKKPAVQAVIFFGAAITGMLGMLTKEIVFSLPLTIILFEFGLNTQLNFKDLIKSKTFLLKLFIPLSFMIVIPYLRGFYWNGYFQPMNTQRFGDPLMTSKLYLFTQFRVIVVYIWKLFIPIRQNLDYDFPVSHGFFEAPVVLGFLLLTGIFLFALYLFPRKRLISIGILWFFIALSVESSIKPIRNVIFEHRIYLAMFGFTLIATGLFYEIFRRRSKKTMTVIFLSIICGYSFLTHSRIKVWKDDISLWSDVVKKSPLKGRAYNNLANGYAMRNQYALAEPVFLKALEINPDHAGALQNYGFMLFSMKKYEKAKEYFHRANENEPDNDDMLINKGANHAMLGEHDEAIECYVNAVQLESSQLSNLKSIADYFFNKKEYDTAHDYYAAIIEKGWTDANASRNFGSINMIKGNADTAIEHFSNALAMNPGDTEAEKSLGMIYYGRKNYSEALKHLVQVNKSRPDDTEILMSIIDSYKKVGDSAQVDSYIQKAKDLHKKLLNTALNLKNKKQHQSADVYLNKANILMEIIN